MPQAKQQSIIYLSFIFALMLSLVVAAQPVAAQVAAVTVTAPQNVLVNEQFEFTVSFDNTGASTGYGPFIDLWIPYNGADGAATAPGADGIIFNDAWFLNVGAGGVAVTAQEFTFPASGCFNHPYLRDPLLNPAPVCGSPGDRLVVLDVPLGAITPGFPVVEITVRATVSPFADVGVPLNILARGGFRFGANPVDDPCCDAYILSAQASAPVTPLVYTMSKRGAGNLLETATGPNFVQSWEIILDIADGQQVDDLTVTDYLPNNVIITGVSSTPLVPGMTTVPGLPFGPVNPPGNELLIDFPSGSPITGAPASDDLVITVQFYGTQNDASGNPVHGGNDPATPDDAPALNRFMGAGDWPPNDVRDGAFADNATFNGLCPTVCPGGSAPVLLGIAVQKTIINVITDNPPAGRSPGDVLEYQLNFQISDYYTYADIQISDVLSDGQAFDGTFTPTFNVFNRGVNYAGNFVPADFDVLAGTPGPGQTALNFRVSDQLATAGLAGGIMQGGRAELPDTTGAEGTIVYRVAILENYGGPVAGNTSAVDQWDTLNNAAVISGTVRANTAPYAPTGDSESDDAFNEFDIVNGEPDKGVYAINGTVCSPCTGVIVQAGDVVTYRIGQTLPASDFDAFSLTEHLPLPVFDVAGFSTVFTTTIDGTPPPVNTAKFGAGETLFGLSGITPGLTLDIPGNAISFNWGGYDGGNNTASAVDVLFSVAVTSRPFADDLTLANLVRSNETSTQNVLHNQDATVPITARAPLLRMTKGAVSSNGPAAFSPGTTGPAPFNPPGSAPSFTGTINSSNLGAAAIDSDLTGLQPGDLVTFAIAIENTGSSSNGAFDIRVRDSIPAGFAVPGGGPNLQVALGSGLAVGYIPLGGGGDNDLFGPGIELIDPGIGVCSPYHATNGSNILIITYDLLLTQEPNGPVTNRGQVFNYSSAEGGFDHTGVQDLVDWSTAFFEVRTGGQATGLEITKEADLAVGQAGDPLTWTIRVTNSGAAPETGITVTDVIPDQTDLIDLVASEGSAEITGRTITWSLGQLLPGEEATLTIRVRIQADADSPGVLVNSAQLLTGSTQVGEAQSQVLIGVETLPRTGEASARPIELLALLAVMAIALRAGLVWVWPA